MEYDDKGRGLFFGLGPEPDADALKDDDAQDLGGRVTAAIGQIGDTPLMASYYSRCLHRNIEIVTITNRGSVFATISGTTYGAHYSVDHVNGVKVYREFPSVDEAVMFLDRHARSTENSPRLSADWEDNVA